MALVEEMELIDCYDCGRPVSFTATACPNCGSREPAGPYQFNRRERRRHRIEERNDRNLVVTALVLGAIGIAYGVEASSSTLGAMMYALLYGFIGVSIGVLLAFAMNVLRFWRQPKRCRW
jgi:hypothetical protein